MTKERSGDATSDRREPGRLLPQADSLVTQAAGTGIKVILSQRIHRLCLHVVHYAHFIPVPTGLTFLERPLQLQPR